MVDTLQFHTWVQFDFNTVKYITHNENGYSAGIGNNNTIVVWKNEQPGPSLDEGQIICVIVKQFSKIDQIQWIVNTDYLLVRIDDKLRVWNIFTNKEQMSFFTTNPILYAKATSLGLLIVQKEGRFTLYTEDREITSQITSDLILDIHDGIIVYPSKFYVDDGVWTETEIGMSWGERGLRRSLEGINNITINGDLILLEDSEIDEIVIPETYRHVFDDCGIIIIREIQGGYILRTKHQGILIGTGPITDAIPIKSNTQVFTTTNHPYYLTRSNKVEGTVKWKKGHLVKVDNKNEVINHDNYLENLPSSMYFDTSQDLSYARYNRLHGFIWFPDQREDYLFYDLYTQSGSIFTNMGREKHSYLLVSKSGRYLLIWNRGKHYPSGKLVLYDIHQPESDGKIIYDENIKSQRIDEEKFTDDIPEDVKFPLIIPEWHMIELSVFTQEIQFSRNYSYSQYYLMVERWSKSENAALLDYPTSVPEKKAFLFFGDLVLTMGDKTVSFENIAPEWKFHEDTGLLAYYSLDGYCYVINTFDKYLLPVFSVETEIPYQIKFSPKGQYLVYLYFQIKETEFITHPKDGHKTKLTTKYPHLTVGIHNISRQQSHHRTVRFPIFLDFDEITIQFKEDQIMVFYPSYTDNSEEAVVMFDTSNSKFHKVNGSSHYRIWMTHAWNSPFASGKNGVEFPVEEHPEISREYSMRPFNLYEGALVRKEDNHPISMADINLISVPQQSTSQLYDLDETVVLSVPFYYQERMKPIYLNKEDLGGLELDQFVKLSRIDEIPKLETIKLDKVPHQTSIRKRLAIFVRKQIDDKIVHTDNGISFQSPNLEEHYQNIEYLVKKARLERFF